MAARLFGETRVPKPALANATVPAGDYLLLQKNPFDCVAQAENLGLLRPRLVGLLTDC